VTPIHRCVEMFVQDRVLRGMSNRTIQQYTEVLGRMTDRIGKGVFIEEAPILEYCYGLAQSGIAKSTLWNYLKQIRCWHSWCVASEFCSPINLPKMRQPKSLIKPMTVQQVKQVLDSFDTSTYLGLRNQMMTRMMFTMGLRVGECIRITIQDLDLGNRKISIHGKGGKEASLPIPKKTAKHLWEYIVLREARVNAKSHHLFLNRNGDSMSPNGVKIVFNRHLQKQFSFQGIRLSAHTFRHSFAVSFLEQGGGNVFELQQLLRHEDLEMTKRYVFLAQGQLRDAMDRSSPDSLI
jgi:integrase/recombinase XerD